MGKLPVNVICSINHDNHRDHGHDIVFVLTVEQTKRTARGSNSESIAQHQLVFENAVQHIV